MTTHTARPPEPGMISLVAYAAARTRRQLRAARERQGLSVSALAGRIGVAQTTLSAWEVGGRRPNYPQTVAWAYCLGLRLDLVPLDAPEGVDPVKLLALHNACKALMDE